VQTVLDVSSITHAFGGLRAITNVSFSVERGHITSLIGPNGAGKTTVFNVVSGFLCAQTGQVTLDGRRIENLPPYHIARLGLGRTFQAPRVFGQMTVLENVVVGLRQVGEKPIWSLLPTESVRAERRSAVQRAENMLALVGLRARRNDLAGTLSFGEQRFLSIARTLVAEPTLVLMDEPTVGLDPAALKKLLDIMTAIASGGKTTLLLIEHHMEAVMAVSDRIVLLVQGIVAAKGTPQEIKADRTMIEAYLGRTYVA